jgi:DNA-binding response OmpR family regulator
VIAAGYADYLTKPVSLKLVKEILDAVEARRKPAA